MRSCLSLSLLVASVVLAHPLHAPATVVIEPSRLVQAKLKVKYKNKTYLTQLKSLKREADSWLSQGPWTVVDKPNPPPNGTIHDYLSQAPYWWPTQPKTEDNPFGCPYEQRDGQRNPDVDTATDRPDIGAVAYSVPALSLAWYYTGDAKYSRHAAKILRTFFLDEETKMNPNLRHGQVIPCQNDGRAIGIIDFSQMYTSVLDAVAILNIGAPGWTKNDKDNMLAWNKEFLDWLVTSDFGHTEGAAKNNHATFHNMQVAALALFAGDKKLAKEVVTNSTKLIDTQIAANGSQPLELARTRTWHYHVFDLVAYTRLANIGKRVGVDLWAYEGPDGQSIKKAIEYIVPAAAGEEEWPHPELEFFRYAASDLVHAGADAGIKTAKAAINSLQAPPKGDMWYLRPAAEQLDSIAG
ncbi:chondroitin AC/alginate lyase [Auriculariales sp. MPI-PUGE-AT-0066]|nr:chondroitin AC/alginate lyase [Auriculariales sp. MPI-PUGE-AT-0066]